MVYTHGGSERQSFPAFHFSPCYAQQYAVNQWLAQRHHYTVLSINYRSGVGCRAPAAFCPHPVLSTAEIPFRLAARVFEFRFHVRVSDPPHIW